MARAGAEEDAVEAAAGKAFDTGLVRVYGDLSRLLNQPFEDADGITCPCDLVGTVKFKEWGAKIIGNAPCTSGAIVSCI